MFRFAQGTVIYDGKATTMIETLKRFSKILQALIKLVPVIIDVMSDFADDGKRNNSNAKQDSKPDSAKTDKGAS
jgi:uncharacterized spore protein YtfJ